MNFSDNTSCYYDSVIVQYNDMKASEDGKGWKVQRYRHPPSYYRTQKEAYQAAVQLYFEAMTEGGEFEQKIHTEEAASKLLQEEG